MCPGVSCKRASERFPSPSTILVRAGRSWVSRLTGVNRVPGPQSIFHLMCKADSSRILGCRRNPKVYRQYRDGPRFGARTTTGKQKVSELGRRFTMSWSWAQSHGKLVVPRDGQNMMPLNSVKYGLDGSRVGESGSVLFMARSTGLGDLS